VPTQNGEAALAALSEESGLPLDKCEVYKHTLGGGFGRRGGAQDYVRQATAIAKQMPGVPIKLIWSREEDMSHDFYRPISQCRLAAGLDSSGKLTALHVRISGQSINAFLNSPAAKDGNDVASCRMYEKLGDAARLHQAESADRVCDAQHARSGRTVARRQHQSERPHMECFMDEAACGRHPSRSSSAPR
jgi:isoquinoline 1-oxidoreductase beta subunit